MPQHPYRHVQSPIPSPSRAEIRPDWDGPRHEANPGSIFNDVVRKVEHELIVKSSPGSRLNLVDNIFRIYIPFIEMFKFLNPIFHL